MSHAKLRICAAFKLHQPQGILPLRRPHVGALHVVLVGSRPDHLGSDLIQIEERLRIGSIVFGNFGGASLTEIQKRKKLLQLKLLYLCRLASKYKRLENVFQFEIKTT